ncbi:helix-turn-helix transcriptional regulator [Amycolatopsis taiwanensis]|uniref:Transcriptional regulator n=1 Tax=Amycolatopsis taiwanensis TaxID=342230 RepID=A0A9W6QU77_9PSEU|nr:helix-turn-helix transcriptional regulator [Amycolatopsis taiwanensis]GLY64121.1 transcriptional regulator [Amycolatopsis taiwanensis]
MTAASKPKDAIRRRELAAFLRSRRERITPEQVGLPSGGRRRTPGLRREEVAQLAGVGVTWYTWLEQGRDINASAQVLEAVSATLRLDPHERAHLFTLAGVLKPKAEPEGTAVSPGLRSILTKLEPYPAAVHNARTDILAYNRVYDWLFDVSRLPFEERNALLQCFTNPEWQARIQNWTDGVPRSVAQFRASMAEHIGEPSWKSLVKRLRQESPAFEVLWRRHDVQPLNNHTKRFLHPEAGRLCFDYTQLWLGRRSDVRLTTYTPADAETEAKLLARWGRG